ncbi:MAG: signal peptide peptidase SppA [Planctomycetes bacterium]|nr:signal peptide peptidase SppA [Planctomycetota bacterium]
MSDYGPPQPPTGGGPFPPGPGQMPHSAAPSHAGPPPGVPYVIVQTGQGRSAGFWIALVLAFFLLGSVGVNFIMLLVLVATHSEMPEGADALVEKEVEPAKNSTTNKIAVLPIEGLITDTKSLDFLTGETTSTVEDVRLFLRRAATDDNVKGVILRVNSPGGGVTASDLIHREIVRFKEETKKPVVALLMDLAASGGYYVAAPCDRIVAHETTITGSIGVILSFYNLSGLGEKIGVKEVVIKSGRNKDIGSMFREMTVEEQAILQGAIDKIYERFVTVVDDGREKLDRDQVLALADGRIYTGDEAQKNGLVDRIGYFAEAVEEVKGLAGIDDARIVTFRSQPSLADILSGNVASRPEPPRVDVDVVSLDTDRSPRFLYLWRVP